MQPSTSSRETFGSSGLADLEREFFGLPVRPPRRCRLLVVDPREGLKGRVEQAAGSGSEALVRVEQVRTLGEARAYVGSHPVDALVCGLELPDGSGLTLLGQTHGGRRRPSVVFLGDGFSSETALAAMRGGAVDILPREAGMEALREAVGGVVRAHRERQEQTARVRRLRRACYKLSEARGRIREQVDVLCQDLVSAYEELAEQVEQSQVANEFRGQIRGELDLEMLLRRSVEFLLERVGPSNVAVFLPLGYGDEFTPGAYVNYDCTEEGAELLLEELADRLAPVVAARGEGAELVSHKDFVEWMGEPESWLSDRQLFAQPCVHEDEVLAVLMLFRSSDEAFDEGALEVCRVVGPLLAEALTRLTRIHHRHHL